MTDPRLAEAVQWYADLAEQQGWKEYAWRMVNDFARDYPAVFGDMPQLLTEEMKRRAA